MLSSIFGQFVANSKLSAHRKICGGMKGPASAPTPANVERKAPKTFATQGNMFLPLFDAHIRAHAETVTACQYLAKVEKFVHYFEATEPNLKMNSLKFAPKAGFPLLSGLESYLSNPEFLDSDKRVAVLASKHICRFVLSSFKLNYGSE